MTVAAPSHSPRVQKHTLKGHRKPVLCLAHSSERLSYYPPIKRKQDDYNNVSTAGTATNTIGTDQHRHHRPSLLLSGSEDGTARLWDLRTKKTAYCMMIPRNEEEGEDLPEVTSVAFHPSVAHEVKANYGRDTVDNKEETPEETADSLLGNRQECTVYVSTSNKIYGYDLRYHVTNSSVTNNVATTIANKSIINPIIKTPHFNLSPLFQCTDEINQLSFSFPKNNDASGICFMSAADDSGEVHISDCVTQTYSQKQQSSQHSSQTKYKQLFHADPETHAITSCAVFKPRSNEIYLASGGTDCMVKLWDVTRPRKPTYTIQIKPNTQGENSAQLCNPPFVHSLSWSHSGRLLAAGIGDGSCAILRGEGRRLLEVGRLGYDEGGHGSAVAAVCFPGFGLSRWSKEPLDVSPKSLLNGEAEDRLMISAGNDGNIIFWDLGCDMVGGGAVDPALLLAGCLSPPSAQRDAKPDHDEGLESSGDDKKNKGADSLKDATEDMDSLHISSKKSKKKGNKGIAKSSGKHNTKRANESHDIPTDLLPSPPKVLFRISHQQKPNWITCSRSSDTLFPSSVFVADTTCNISVYSLPL